MSTDLSPVETLRKSLWDPHGESRGPKNGLSPFGVHALLAMSVGVKGFSAQEATRVLKYPYPRHSVLYPLLTQEEEGTQMLDDPKLNTTVNS